MMGNLPLSGYSVVDFGRGQAASQAALFLQQLGAQVTKVEDARESRRLSANGDALWNRGKARISIEDDLAAALDEQIRGSDVLIHDRLPSEALALGLESQSLVARYPDLIHVAIGGWPLGHPLQETPVDDAIVLAQSGLLDEQAAFGRDGPVWLRLPMGSAIAAYLAAAGALARLHARHRTGKGGRVSTSLVQGAMLPMLMHWRDAERPSRSVLFGMPKNSGATMFECADGKWIHTMGAPQQAPAIGDALAAMDPAVRARHNAKYADAIVQYPGLGAEWGAVEAIFLTRPHDEWLPILWDADVPAQPILPMGALYFDEQVRANDYATEAAGPDGQTVFMPGAPFSVQPAAAAPLPALGTETIVRPLEGLRVLDLGNFLAGPIAPMLLGDLGADVVKLEATGGDPLRPVEWAFNGCQRSKRSVAVQLKESKGREIMERLVEWADIVHHNQRLPAAAKLGFDWPAVHRVNPAAIYCHVSSYGSRGPRKDWPGYDQLFQASCGWEEESAGEGNPPMWLRFGMIDHLGGLASLVATLAAVVRRDASGEGEQVSASLLGACMASLECFASPDGTLSPRPKLDSAQMGVGNTERLYRTADGWVAVSDGRAAAEARLATMIGAKDAETWFAGRETEAALAALQRADLMSARVAMDNGTAFLTDRDNIAAQLSVTVTHPVYGRYTSPGASWNFGDLSLDLERPIPLLGQQSSEIMTMIGYSQAEQDALAEAGLIKV